MNLKLEQFHIVEIHKLLKKIIEAAREQNRFKGVGAFWQIRIWALDEKLFTGFIYFSQYTTRVMFHTLGNFCNYRISELLFFKGVVVANRFRLKVETKLNRPKK